MYIYILYIYIHMYIYIHVCTCIINPSEIGVISKPQRIRAVDRFMTLQAEPVKAVQLAADAEIYFQREQERFLER